MAAFIHLSPDWIVIGVCVVVLSFDAFRSGVGRVVACALAFPITSVFLDDVSRAWFVETFVARLSTPLLNAAEYGVVFAVVYVLVYRMSMCYFGESGHVLLALLSGMAGTVIIVTFFVHTPALAVLWNIGQPIRALFAAHYEFWWLLGSYGALAWARG